MLDCGESSDLVGEREKSIHDGEPPPDADIVPSTPHEKLTEMDVVSDVQTGKFVCLP